MGTCSTAPAAQGFTATTTIDVAKPYETSPYTGYMMEDTWVPTIFDSLPSGNNCWRWIDCTSAYGWLFGGDLNDATTGGNPSDPFVCIEVCEQMGAYYVPHTYLDDIAIAIY